VSSSELPVLKPRELIRALERMGFHLLRKSKGSHWQFEHADGRRTTVPVHKGPTSAPACCGKSCGTQNWTPKT